MKLCIDILIIHKEKFLKLNIDIVDIYMNI